MQISLQGGINLLRQATPSLYILILFIPDASFRRNSLLLFMDRAEKHPVYLDANIN